ncbi:hypothetical protein D3C76_1645670 [compost metagenome]
MGVLQAPLGVVSIALYLTQYIGVTQQAAEAAVAVVHGVLAIGHHASLTLWLSGAVVLALQGDALLLAGNQAGVLLVVDISGFVMQPLAPDLWQPP